MGGKRGTVEERFWRFVVKGENEYDCWTWTGGKTLGYGQLSAPCPPRVPSLRANRVSWELHYGPIPDGLHVLHYCDNRQCTNPHHLFLGTNDDNIRDMHSKNRQSGGSLPGETSPVSVLTNEQVREIRNMYTGKYGEQVAIARIYGVGYQVIHDVVHGNTYPNV